MLAKKRSRPLALLLTIVMILSLLPLSALAVIPSYSSADQIVDAGGTTDPASGKVILNKTVAATDTEGKFKITLGVTTKDKITTGSTSESTTADVVLVIDASGSMGGGSSRLDKAKTAATGFVTSFLGSTPDGKRKIAVVPYSEYVNTTGLLGLTSDATELTNDINSISSGGGTNIMDGLRQAGSILASSTASHKYVVLLTDGEPTYYYDGIESSRESIDESNFISVGSDDHIYQQDYVYTQFDYTVRRGWGNGTGRIYAYNTVSQAKLLKDDGIEIFGIGIDIGTSRAGRYTLYNSVTLTGTAGSLSYAGHYFDYSSSSGSDLAAQLANYFEVISRNITVKTNSWLISDTMGSMFTFADFVSGQQNTATQSGGVLTWNLKAAGTAVTGNDTDGWTYSTQYYVTLKTSDGSFASNTAYDTNAGAALTYSFDDDVYPSNSGGHLMGEMILHSANFRVPQVKGFLANLKFTKVAAEDTNKTLAQAQFTLDGTTSVGAALAAQHPGSDNNGQVTVSNLPAGTYTLTETTAPGGYDLISPITVTIAFGTAYISGTAIGDNYNYKVSDPLHQILTDVPIAKNWLAPESFKEPVKITLNVDGSPFGTITLDGQTDSVETTAWNAVFHNVPSLNLSTGQPAVYTFTETGAGGAPLAHSYTTTTAKNAGGVYVITNLNNSSDTRDIQVTKTWDKPGDISVNDYVVRVYLTIGGVDTGTFIELNKTNNWTNRFTSLLKYDSVTGQEINYGIKEVKVEGFSAGVVTGDADHGFTIKNTIAQSDATIQVTKAWVDYNNHYNTRGQVEITLYADDVAVNTMTLDGTADAIETSAWTGVFTTDSLGSKLPKYKFNTDGSYLGTINYTVDETSSPEDYTAAVTGSATAGYTVTNTLDDVKDLTVSVEKQWILENTGSEVTVSVSLFRNGSDTVIETIQISASPWTGSFAAVESYDKTTGNALTYRVTENSVDGFTLKDITGDQTHGFIITNMQNLDDQTSVTVNKVWVDSGADPTSSGYRPDATFTLWADGVKTDESITLDGGDDGTVWTGSFTGLAKNKYAQVQVGTTEPTDDSDPEPIYETQAVPIVYTVTEDNVSGYTEAAPVQDVNTFTFTNTIEQDYVDIPVEKVWVDTCSESHPAFTIDLWKGTVGSDPADAVDHITIPADATGDSLKVTFTHKPKYDLDNGAALIHYVVSERGVVGYNNTVSADEIVSGTVSGTQSNYTITNTVSQQYETITGAKTWIGPAADQVEVTVNLLQDNVVVSSVNVTSGSYTFSNTNRDDGKWPIYKDGMTQKHVYTVQEVGCPSGYTSIPNGYSFTNKVNQVYTQVHFTKTWVDPTGTTHPDATFILKQDDTEVNRFTLTDGTNEHTFTTYADGTTSLPTYKEDGSLYEYTVAEVPIDGYTESTDSNDSLHFINTIEQATISVPVSKEWSSQLSETPTVPVTLQLQKNDEDVPNVTITLDGTADEIETPAWTASFTGLNKYDLTTGQTINYSVRELELSDYSSDRSGDQTEGYVFTNTYKTYCYRVDAYFTLVTNGTPAAPVKEEGSVIAAVKGSTYSADPDDYIGLAPETGYVYQSGSGNTSVTITTPYSESEYVHTINLYFVKTVNTDVTIYVAHEYYADGSLEDSVSAQPYTVTHGSAVTASAYSQPTHGIYGYTLRTNDANAQNISSVHGGETITLKYDRDIPTYTVTYTEGEHGNFDADVHSGVKEDSSTPGFAGTVDTATGKPAGESGFTFAGWYPSVASTVTESKTYVAQWTPNEGTTYKVEYYFQNAGSYPTSATSSVSRTGTTGSTVSVTDDDKIASGYILDTAAGNEESGTVKGDNSLVLKLYFKPQFTVTYKPGSQGTFAQVSYSGLSYGDSTPTAPQVTGNSGYTFAGWSSSIASTVTGNAEYVATWSKDGGGGGDDDDTPTYFTVHYQFSGDHPSVTLPSDETYESGTTVQVADGYDDVTTADGVWSFSGWSKSGEFKVTGNITITGKWTYTPNETSIDEEEPPLGETPTEQPGEVEVVDEETPLGNLPQTGTTQADLVKPMWTLAMMALAFSMVSAGLTITFTRKKEEEHSEN